MEQVCPGVTLPAMTNGSPTCAAAVEGQQRLREQQAALEQVAESLRSQRAALEEVAGSLRSQRAALEEVAGSLRSQLATAELRVRKAGLDARDTTQQMAYLQEQLQVGLLSREATLLLVYLLEIVQHVMMDHGLSIHLLCLVKLEVDNTWHSGSVQAKQSLSLSDGS